MNPTEPTNTIRGGADGHCIVQYNNVPRPRPTREALHSGHPMPSVRDRIRDLAVRLVPPGGQIEDVKFSVLSHGRTAPVPFTAVLEVRWRSRTGKSEVTKIEERGETRQGVELAMLGRLEGMR